MAVAGLLVSPVAASCDVRDAAAMACCQGDMSDCNKAGKTADCCRVNLSDPQTAVATVTPADTRDPSYTLAIWPPSPPLAAQLAAWPLVHVRAGLPLPHGSPPRSPVLRL